jgi:hypothetical protein
MFRLETVTSDILGMRFSEALLRVGWVDRVNWRGVLGMVRADNFHSGGDSGSRHAGKLFSTQGASA